MFLFCESQKVGTIKRFGFSTEEFTKNTIKNVFFWGTIIMLLDNSDALEEWEVPVVLKQVTVVRVDGENQDIITPSNVLMNVQPTDPAGLKAENIDTTLRTLKLWYRGPLNKGEFVEFQGLNYRITNILNWRTDENGTINFSRALAQHYQKAL